VRVIIIVVVLPSFVRAARRWEGWFPHGSSFRCQIERRRSRRFFSSSSSSFSRSRRVVAYRFLFCIERKVHTKKVSVRCVSNENESASLSAIKVSIPTNTQREKRESEREWDEAIFSESSSPSRANFSNFTRAKKQPVTNATKLNLPCSRQISVLRISLYPFFPSPRGWTVSGWAFCDCFYALSSYKCVRFFVTNTCFSPFWGKKYRQKNKKNKRVLWALAHTYLLCLDRNAPENSCACVCVCVCSSCEFSALKSLQPRRYVCFSLRFLRGLTIGKKEEKKGVRLSHKNTTRDSTYLFSIHAHKTHRKRERTAFRRLLREFERILVLRA